MTIQLTSIYKSDKREGLYLYTNKAKGLSQVPEALLILFGKPILVTHMLINANKKLAKVDAALLLEKIQTHGFYLQMPDPLPEYKQFLANSNQKLNVSILGK